MRTDSEWDIALTIVENETVVIYISNAKQKVNLEWGRGRIIYEYIYISWKITLVLRTHDIGSNIDQQLLGNCFVPSDNKRLPIPMLTSIYDAM